MGQEFQTQLDSCCNQTGDDQEINKYTPSPSNNSNLNQNSNQNSTQKLKGVYNKYKSLKSPIIKGFDRNSTQYNNSLGLTRDN